MPFIFRRFFKSKSLRVINLLGLILMFACLLISYSYIKKEIGYDKFYTNAHRIVRMTFTYDNNTADGRLYGGAFKNISQGIPQIEDELKLSLINTGVITANEKKQIINNLYYASDNLLKILDIPLLEGNSQSALSSPQSVIISERLAKELYGRTDVIEEKIELTGRKIPVSTFSISGVYKDMPDNTHFHTDIIVRAAEEYFSDSYYYSYLLLRDASDKENVEQKLQSKYVIENPEVANPEISLMSMADIHLHSKVLREMEPNGNIYYIYLIAGINILLLIIVLFNLWLNSSVIFSYNKRYYQLLRLNGASSAIVIQDEFKVSLLLSAVALLGGKLTSIFVTNYFSGSFPTLSIAEECIIALLFLGFSILISLLPVFINLSSTFFFNDKVDLKQTRLPLKNVKYMLITQYAIVIFIILVGAGINSQMSLINATQLAAKDDNVVVLDEQPQEVIAKFGQLKNELLKHTEIESVTAAMQLPGSAVRDMVGLKLPGKEAVWIPVLVVGEDFFPTFNIKPLYGELFPPSTLTFTEEEALMFKKLNENKQSSLQEHIVINKKAMSELGFATAEDAVGKEVELEHSHLDYLHRCIISGVVDNFTYTNVYEEAIPMVVLQRNLFMNCFIIQFAPQKNDEAIGTLNSVWQSVNPDYPINYRFLTDSYKTLYQNELNAQRIVSIFSILSFIITALGLITFMAFMIKSRVKEIGIRKVNGATNGEIIMMLNISLLKWVLLAFVIAIPAAWYVLGLWLDNFAYKTTLDWWLFASAGFAVLAVSAICISVQTWKAATTNPVNTLKNE